jgi:3-phenylpropionate/trans-cinnamate dioxygenase ferredoxin reductase subunit
VGERRIVVVGAGLGAYRVAEQLRKSGHQGTITVLGAEVHRPYDRPPLSKQVLRGERDSTTFADTDQLDVRWILGSPVLTVEVDRCKVVSEGGLELGYDTLVLAPGGRPRTLPGVEVGSGIHVLRTIDDAETIRNAMHSSKRLVVVGAGFIGCEIAASARLVGCEVDLIEGLAAPLIRVLGSDAASRVTDLHNAHGVRMHLGATVDSVLRDEGASVRGVRLGDGSIVEGRDVVVGIGIVPDVDWLVGSGVEIGDGIRCDGNGRTNVDNVYALGDAAQWWHPLAGEHRRIEHWTTTTDQAAVVAATIMSPEPEAVSALAAPPYFWSDQYDVKIQGIGFIDPRDDVELVRVRGRDVLLYSRDRILRGVVGFSIPAAVMRTKPLIERRATVGEAVDLLTP